MAVKRAFQKAKSDNVFGHARKPAKMFRVGLYARVSTNDRQTLPMQSRAMREYAARRGWTVAVQVREVGSGAAKREAREKLLEAARRHAPEAGGGGPLAGGPPLAVSTLAISTRGGAGSGELATISRRASACFSAT